MDRRMRDEMQHLSKLFGKKVTRYSDCDVDGDYHGLYQLLFVYMYTVMSAGYISYLSISSYLLST